MRDIRSLMTNPESKAQGERIDNHYESISLSNFNYAECTDCHTIVELPQTNVGQWKFSLMGLRPSILKVAKGVCPVCQDMRKQFRGILGQ